MSMKNLSKSKNATNLLESSLMGESRYDGASRNVAQTSRCYTERDGLDVNNRMTFLPRGSANTERKEKDYILLQEAEKGSEM